jgi:hypothetical protein
VDGLLGGTVHVFLHYRRLDKSKHTTTAGFTTGTMRRDTHCTSGLTVKHEASLALDPLVRIGPESDLNKTLINVSRV